MAASFAFRTAGEGFNSYSVPGAYNMALVEVTAGTTDYTAGGYSFAAANMPVPCNLIYQVIVADHWRTAAGGGTASFLAVWDAVNSKVQAYGMAAAAGVSTGLTEVANSAATMNGLRCTLLVFYR